MPEHTMKLIGEKELERYNRQGASGLVLAYRELLIAYKELLKTNENR